MGDADIGLRQAVFQRIQAVAQGAHKGLELVDMALLAVVQQAVRQALAGPVEDQHGKAHGLKLAGNLEIFLDELGPPGADNRGAARGAQRQGRHHAGAQGAPGTAGEPDKLGPFRARIARDIDKIVQGNRVCHGVNSI